MDKGVYCLILENSPCRVKVGALGTLDFSGGWHVYVGSAGGAGGLLRVVRHIRYSRHPYHKPRWHIDYILAHPAFSLVSVLCAPSERDMECRLAGRMPAVPVAGFGCSDCKCISHLFYFDHPPEQDVSAVFENLEVGVSIKNIKKS
jgi:Uri superfamily endonuclease